jgi:hypothetical protein
MVTMVREGKGEAIVDLAFKEPKPETITFISG